MAEELKINVNGRVWPVTSSPDTPWPPCTRSQ
jgi:hypothetical protein